MVSWRIMRHKIYALFPAVLFAAAAAAQTYTIVDLGELGGGLSAAWGINNQGQVSGFSWATVGGCLLPSHAFRTTANEPINPETDDLGTFEAGCFNSYAYRVNDAGEVAGYGDGPGYYSAFVYSNGQIQRLPSLMECGCLTKAYGINNQSQVVGYSYHPLISEGWHAVLWENGELVDLGGYDATAYGINDQGQVVGETGIPYRPFIWDPTTKTMQVLDNPFGDPPANAAAYSINENGLIVGYGQENVSPNYPAHAFIYDSNTGEFTRIGPEGTVSVAYGINNNGQVVGALGDIGLTHDYGFLYSGGEMRYLEGDLVPSDSGWRNLVATGINDAGQIAGSGEHNGRARAFLLTPNN
jgi:probable HAF family extracellular repeat protein